MFIFADFSVLLYKSFSTFDEEHQERFRFKLVDSHVLIKPRFLSAPEEESYSRESIFLDSSGKMALVLHPSKPFGIFMRHGQPVCLDIGKQ